MEAANVENTKICTGCKKEMLATKEFFHAAKLGKYGLRSMCKQCKNSIGRKYRENNREKEKERKKKYYKNNFEKEKERVKKYRKNNSEKCMKDTEKWRKNNPEKVKEYSKKHYEDNSEKCKENNKKWAKNNPEKVKEKAKKYSKEATKNLSNAYIATRLKTPLKHLNPQIIETRRLIILIKRELRKNNFKTLETMQDDSTNKNNSQMENNLKENDNKRDLNFEVKNSDDLNKMLSGFLMDVRRGSVTHYSANSINLVADKINKNNLNQLEYKRLSGGDRKIDFFEKE
jgi:hypothetical protein